jgi:hypothetical protein
MKIIVSRNLRQDQDTGRTVFRLDRFHHVLTHQLLQHDHIYRLVARIMAVRFGGSNFNLLNFAYHDEN